MPEQIIIIGAGQAGAQAVATLRAEGFEGTLTMVGDEPFAPYQRPPLSKTYLSGTLDRERLFLKPDAFFTEARCELLTSVSATAIDRAEKTVTLSDGRSLDYDKLLIATGSRVRKIPVPGANLNGVHYLRNIADVDGLRPAFESGKKLAIIGGGYIGLEVAAVAAKRGLDVTVFEAMDRTMQRVASSQISAFYEQVHKEAGVKFNFKALVEAFEGEGNVTAVRASGHTYAADLVLVGIGVMPNQELAANAGLECKDGILVDRTCASTTDPSIFAAGDCTRHYSHEDQLVRLESVQNAIEQAKHAALAMAGKPKPYKEVPWFWSDQYDLKLQIAGLARPEDEIVVRGDLGAHKFAAFHLRDGAVVAVEAVNAAPEYIIGRKLVADGTKVSRERLADTAIHMKNIV